MANPKESSEEKEAEEEEKMMKTITKMKEMMMLMMIMTGPILTKKAGSNIGDNKLIHKLTSERQQFGLLHAATPAASICMFVYLFIYYLTVNCGQSELARIKKIQCCLSRALSFSLYVQSASLYKKLEGCWFDITLVS